MASIYFRSGTTWVVATEVYKKVNGTWVKQTNLNTALEDDTVYIPRSRLSYLTTENHVAITFGGDKILV